MSYFFKKSWIALTLMAAAFSIAYASCGCNRKPTADGNNKPKQIVLDRLINELVCKTPRWGMSSEGLNLSCKVGKLTCWGTGDKVIV